MFYEKVVAAYDTTAHADAAVNTLKSAGYSSHDISVIRNEGDIARADFGELGFWQRLFGRDINPHEAEVYGRALRQGGAIVTVRVPDSEAPKVMKLLDTHKPVDVLDRARMYGLVGAETTKTGAPTSGMFRKDETAPSPTTLRKDEEVVRLAEEQINVSKRQVEGGKTRVRRFIVERPVEANVTLHEEHCEVVRRAITDPSYVKDIDWSEQVIEVTDTIEEPVVSKSARVAEEVVIRKKGSDRIETIHDTVRKQQLEVEKVPLETARK
ncbi:MAG TPA: YsnF/AvaK domain-containing protein [Bryobacteraceae bacterium]|nr:YsnF/AvaK domain-containing protein [Bryobacteraceae bacterium]